MWLNNLQIKSSVPLGKSSGVGFVSIAQELITFHSLVLLISRLFHLHCWTSDIQIKDF